MNEKLAFFSQIEGNLLIRLLLAHLVADFLLQTKDMVSGKKWFSKQMVWHIMIVFAVTWGLSGIFLLALAIAAMHWVIDGVKIELQKRNILSEIVLFIVDQFVHTIVIVMLWSLFLHNFFMLIHAIYAYFINYKFSLILLGYAIITTPVGYLIKYATKDFNTQNNQNIQHGGKWIGVFERIIILTFVLLGQYSAIGFLITGKSIIRFANKDEHIQSEYVLVGTMMSYALAILTGAGMNFLLKL
jgi:hypothetical protein